MAASSPETATRGGWDITKLQDFINRPPESGQTLEELRDFASSEDYLEIALGLGREDGAKLVNVLDQVRHPGPPRCLRSLDNNRDDQSIDCRDPQNVKLLRALSSICSATIQLPRTVIIPDGIEICGDVAMASGGFTDTWRGLYQGKSVALKAFRTFFLQDLRGAQKVRSTSWQAFPL